MLQEMGNEIKRFRFVPPGLWVGVSFSLPVSSPNLRAGFILLLRREQHEHWQTGFAIMFCYHVMNRGNGKPG